MYCTSPSVIWCCVAPLRKRSDGYVHARDHAHGSEAAPVFSSVCGHWPFRLWLVMRCWTHSSTLPAPFELYEWSGTGCSGRWSVQPGGPTGAGGELMCQRRGKRCADPLCMQHCVEARSGTRKRLRGVRGVRGSWCGAMNGGRDGWGDSLASFPSRRRRRKKSSALRNAQWASHSSVYKTVGRGRADPGCQSYRLIPGNKGGINRRSKSVK